MVRRRTKANTNVLAKIKTCIENEDYYEAHQMYRTVFARHMSVNMYGDAIHIAESGVRVLFNANQITSGSDLCMLIIDAYNAADLSEDEASLSRLIQLFNLFVSTSTTSSTSTSTSNGHKSLLTSSSTSSSSSIAAAVAAVTSPNASPVWSQFMRAALKWSIRCGPNKRGAPTLHHAFAMALLVNANDFSLAQKHFILGTKESIETFGRVIVTQMSQLSIELQPILITRAILMLLCLEDLHYANILFDTFTLLCPGLDEPPYPVPLYNFLRQLLLICQRGSEAASLFTRLHESYRSYLVVGEVSQALNGYLSNIGQLYFNIKPNRSGGGLFDIMASMFGGNQSVCGRANAHPNDLAVE